MYQHDKCIVMTLDAGGTNFVFSAMSGYEEQVQPYCLPSHADQLERCLETLISGFQHVQQQLTEPAVAISFAFPGPADYQNGIIMDLPNMSAFKGGVALGPFLASHFQLPVFINNDGDLFAYGESIAGALPELNRLLEASGNPKRYHNTLGFTLGTGFGGGIARNNDLYLGDNGAAGELWLLRHKNHRTVLLEEGVSIRAIQRVYRETSGDQRPLSPKDIYDIAEGTLDGDAQAARLSFEAFGENAGEGIALVSTLLDGLVVLGGGIAAARRYFMPALMSELNGTINLVDGSPKPRLELTAFDLEDPDQKAAFLTPEVKHIPVPGTSEWVSFDPVKRLPVMFSTLGTSRAIAIGAYAFALRSLDTVK